MFRAWVHQQTGVSAGATYATILITRREWVSTLIARLQAARRPLPLRGKDLICLEGSGLPEQLARFRRETMRYRVADGDGGRLAKYWPRFALSCVNPVCTFRLSASTTSDTFFPVTGSSWV